jgi:hypothetical protein
MRDNVRLVRTCTWNFLFQNPYHCPHARGRRTPSTSGILPDTRTSTGCSVSLQFDDQRTGAFRGTAATPVVLLRTVGRPTRTTECVELVGLCASGLCATGMPHRCDYRRFRASHRAGRWYHQPTSRASSQLRQTSQDLDADALSGVLADRVVGAGICRTPGNEGRDGARIRFRRTAVSGYRNRSTGLYD